MANSVATPEESNHLRAVYLSYRVTPKAVRTFFDKIHPPSLLTTHLNNDFKYLSRIKGNVIKNFQWSQLYPSSGLPTSSDFDLTLMICLLRNMTPSVQPPPFGFDNLPNKSHTTEGAHLARIKFYRNQLAHSSEGKMSVFDFESLWNDLNEAIVGLGGSGFNKELIDSKTIGLDSPLVEMLRELPNLENKYEQLLTKYENLATNVDRNTAYINRLGNEIAEVFTSMQKTVNIVDNLTLKFNQLQVSLEQKDEVSKNDETEITQELAESYKKLEEDIAETIPQNKREQIEIRLNEWRKENQKFLSTSAAEKVCKHIRDYNCVTVTGSSGAGKTAAVRNAALDLLQEGYVVVPVSTPEDILNFYNPKKRTLFVIDDLCGRYTLNQQYLNDWKLRLDEIKLLLKNGHCKIMATCRLQVFYDERFTDLSIFKSCECNLNSKELSLSAEEISSFVLTYCGEHSSNVNDLLKTCKFVPLLCSLFQKTKSADIRKFFSNPFQFYDKELEHLLREDDSSKYKYCCLVLVVLFNNRLKEELFWGKIDNKVKKIIKDTLAECELNRSTSPKCLLKSISTLEGSFLVKEEGFYRTIHDKLFDYLSHYFGNKMIRILIDHADSEFIRERFIWMTANQVTDNEFTITITNERVDDYIDRMIRDWSDGKVLGVLTNRNMKLKDFTAKLLCHLNKLDSSCQSQLAQKRVDNKYGDVTLILSSFNDDVNFARWIINNGVSVNKYRNDGTSPLYIACQNGHMGTVIELIKCGADLNKCCDNGVSPLYIACQNGHLDTVRELIKFGADLNKCKDRGTSPLYISCQEGHLDIVKELIQSNVDINKFQHVGESPLFVAVIFNNKEIVKVLLDNNSDVNKCANNKEKYCEAIVKYHNKTTESYMDSYRSNCIFKHALPKVNKYIQESLGNQVLDLVVGSSPLHMACFMGHIEIVRFILEKSPNINIIKEDGTTPLFFACEFGHPDIVKLMIEKGADDTICRIDGKSPYQIAFENGNSEVLDLLSGNKNILKVEKHVDIGFNLSA